MAGLAGTGNLITDRVKQLVRMRGPLIPSQISKEIGTNILMASAILSELSSKGDVRISSLKIGGTPLYYVPGQEAKLLNYTSGLHPKEKEALEQLKAMGVLKDSSLEPATRVAMRQIRDFAKPVEASIDGNITLFWKWHLVPNEEAEAAIKKMMGTAEQSAGTGDAPLQAFAASPASPFGAQAIIETVSGAEAQPSQAGAQAGIAPLLYSVQQQLRQHPNTEQLHNKLSPAPATSTAEATPQKQGKPAKPRQATAATELSELINAFFTRNGIEMESEVTSKKSEVECIISLPSPVGKLRHYCVAKNKKTCTDADISSAMVQGQIRKLPVLLLTKGELSKKAQELLSKEIGAIVVKKI
ncbi:hypothetical protein HYU17_00160 [Candidatus Woesearchaeota archaeon]|nr:hypothetical protein [Candidatus Woesearchaeota archaeon]